MAGRTLQGHILEAFDISNHSIKWHSTINSAALYFPYIANNFTYFCEEKHLVAMDISTGKPSWDCTIGNPLSPPSKIENGTIFVVAENKQPFLYAIDSVNGQIKWRVALPLLPYMLNIEPIIGQQIVFLSTQNGGTAFNKSDGSFIWEYKDAPILHSIGAGSGVLCLSYPIHKPREVKTYSLGAKFIETREKVHVLRETDGLPLWTYTLADEEAIASSLETFHLINKGITYLVTAKAKENALLAFSADNGELIWNYSLKGATLSKPFIEGNILYIGSNDGYIQAFQADSGTFLWKTFVSTSHQIGIGGSELQAERGGSKVKVTKVQ